MMFLVLKSLEKVILENYRTRKRGIFC